MQTIYESREVGEPLDVQSRRITTSESIVDFEGQYFSDVTALIVWILHNPKEYFVYGDVYKIEERSNYDTYEPNLRFHWYCEEHLDKDGNVIECDGDHYEDFDYKFHDIIGSYGWGDRY